MKKISKTLLFFGSGPVAASSLDFLSKHFEIEAVVTKTVPSHHKTPAPVETLAKKLSLKTLFANDKNELITLFNSYTPSSRLGIVVDYGVIIPSKIIDLFPLGIINSHFSLLPQWRGADPISYSILSGQSKTGVSLMVIERGLDTGKLIAQISLPISADDTTPSLTEKLIELSNQTLKTYIPLYYDGLIKSKRQSHPDRATYSSKLRRSDGEIDSSKSAIDIEREIRAFSGWPGSHTTVMNRRVKVIKAHTSADQESSIDIKCGDGIYLVIDELIAPSGKKMNAKAFVNGYIAG